MFHTPAHKQPTTPAVNFNQFKVECLHCDGRWHEAGALWTRAGYPRFDTEAAAEEAATAAYGAEHAEFIRIRPVVLSRPVCRIETLRPAFKIPPAGVRVRLGDLLKSRHLYVIGVGGGWSIEVDANDRNHATRIAEREGYTVHDVNMVG